ncbi:MAG: hypothetical protein OXB88_01890 [Bacteriovoracales bacterium]|nr:hypothetical protein [Bacteriovoracales bacterium]
MARYSRHFLTSVGIVFFLSCQPLSQAEAQEESAPSVASGQNAVETQDFKKTLPPRLKKMLAKIIERRYQEKNLSVPKEKIAQAVEKVLSKNEKGLPPAPSSPPVDKLFTPSQDLDTKIDEFTLEVQKDYMGICEDRKNLEETAQRHALSPMLGQRICHLLLQELLHSLRDSHITGVEEELLGPQVDTILKGLSLVERDMAHGDMRIRFAGAHKPGMTPLQETTTDPQLLLINENSPWYCTSRRPFPASDLSTFMEGGVKEIQFVAAGHTFTDSDDFIYNLENGYELTGWNRTNQMLRSIRFAHPCDPGDGNCQDTDETTVQTLIIEESLTPKSPLLQDILTLFYPQMFNDEEGADKDGQDHTLAAFVQSKPSLIALTDYSHEDERSCTDAKGNPLPCEIVVGYTECWKNPRDAFASPGASSRSSKIP